MALLLLAGGASAQTDYPSRPITVVVPFAAGGPTDTVARLLAESMTQTLKQQVLVENAAGAGGTGIAVAAAEAQRNPVVPPAAGAVTVPGDVPGPAAGPAVALPVPGGQPSPGGAGPGPGPVGTPGTPVTSVKPQPPALLAPSSSGHPQIIPVGW